MNSKDTKKLNISYKNTNKNIVNLKNSQHSSRDHKMIHKANTNFINNKITQDFNNHNYLINPFTDSNNNSNIKQKELYHQKEDSEPNANKILTNKSTKTIKEIKNTQKMKTNYKTNTVTSLQVNTQELLSQSNQNNNQTILSRNNNNNKSAKSIKINSYKSSTHKTTKNKKLQNLSYNSNNNRICINKSEKTFTESSKNQRGISKSHLSPENRASPKKAHNNSQYEGSKKAQNYTEIYIKYTKIQNHQNQRLNTTNNITTNQHSISNQNSVRGMKTDILNNRLNYSNEKIIKREKIIRTSNNTFITNEGKRYVLSKNVQRVRREYNEKGIKNDEKKDNYTNIDENKISQSVNNF